MTPVVMIILVALGSQYVEASESTPHETLTRRWTGSVGTDSLSTDIEDYQTKMQLKQIKAEHDTFSVTQVEDMPEACQSFARVCGHSSAELHITSWRDTATAFEACCLGGGHKNSTCSSIAEETFDNRKGPFALDTSVCEELMDLTNAHFKLYDSRDEDSTDNAVSLRATLVVERMVELKDTAPNFVGPLLATLTGVAVLTSGASTLAQVAITSTAMALATRMGAGCCDCNCNRNQDGCGSKKED